MAAFGPFRSAESGYHSLRVTITLLVLELQPKISQFPQMYKFRHTFSPPVQQITTMIRILWRGISEPIQYAESFCGLHLSLASLVGELQAKAFPISEVENSGSIYSSPLSPLSSTIKTPRRGISGPT